MRRGWCPDVFSPMPSGDGLLVRVKPPGGVLAVAALRAVGDAAARFGNGAVELTSRGNLQIRGLRTETVAPFAAAMVGAGLAVADAAVERRRNVLVSPLAGIDPTLPADTAALAAALVEKLTAASDLAALPPKFQFMVDGGGALPLADVRADIVVRATAAGWCVALDGGQRAAAAGVVGGADAALALARAFLRLRGGETARMRDAVARHGEARIFTAAGLDAKTETPAAAFSALPAGVIALGLPFGQCDMPLLAELAARFGAGSIRLTPWRTVLLTGVTDSAALRHAARALILDNTDPRGRIAACPGRDACASATVDARGDAAWLANQGIAGQIHVSGCAKGCAHPGAAPIALVGDGGRYRLVRNGRAGDAAIATGLTREAAADLLREMAV